MQGRTYTQTKCRPCYDEIL